MKIKNRNNKNKIFLEEEKYLIEMNKDKRKMENKDTFLKIFSWVMLIVTVLSVMVLAIISGVMTYNDSVSSGIPAGIPGLQLSMSLFFATFIALIIIFIISTYFFWKPMKEHLEIRKTNIETNISAASYKNKEAEEHLIKSASTEKTARITAKEIVAASKQEANDEKRSIISEAKEQTDKIIEQSREQIVKEKKQMQEEIKLEILQTSLLAAEKIIEKNMDSKKNIQMIEELISKLN